MSITFVPTYPLYPTLANAITKTRKITGSSNSFQVTDSYIVQQMHSFYAYDLPAKFRSLKLQDIYTFTTNVGQEVYAFNSELYTTAGQPASCSKRELRWFNSPWSFFANNYNWQSFTNFATGDGTTGSQTGLITGITNATNAVVTATNHGLVSGTTVILNGVGGMIQVNGNSYNITVINANSFYLNVNSTTFSSYTSGGSWYTSPYNGFTTDAPFVPSVNNDPGPQSNPNLFFPQSRVQNILITANVIGPNGVGQTQNVTDDGEGNLIQIFQTSNNGNEAFGWSYYRQYASSTPQTPGNATINYQTGEILGLTFADPIPAGTPIQIQYNPKQLSIPLAILFYQNQFTLAPVPDAGYTIEVNCYRQPIQALLASDQAGNPELSEWWEILAVGASKKIFEERLDSDGVIFIDKMLKERYDIIESRTYAQIGQESINTIYSDQLKYNYGLGGLSATFGSL
jgi:ubiquitin-activating enzyme E1-like protein